MGRSLLRTGTTSTELSPVRSRIRDCLAFVIYSGIKDKLRSGEASKQQSATEHS